MGEKETVIQAKGLTRVYSGKKVLNDLSLDVRAGETLAVMGPSGGGKTVLLKHLIGLLEPEKGTVSVFGRDFWKLSARQQRSCRRNFGYAFQEGALFDSMDVATNIGFPLRRNHDFSQDQIDKRVQECLAMVRLPTVGPLPISALSTGMRRRVGFARAIALEPKILLFDEPTAGLDPVLVTVMSKLIREIHKKLGAATVVVTHDLASVRIVADRVALLFKGRIEVDAPTFEFLDLDHPVVRQMVEGNADGPLTDTEDVMRV
jgi:phospholipid/cholesterol/gamma-HCH transport system ATP-binding protein